MTDHALAGLRARALPAWYDAAKFGIFIHWGLFAIPAFAARLGSISDAFKRDYDRAVAMTPYTEWYANAIKVPGTPSAEFHRATFGDRPYERFAPEFLAGMTAFDADEWAEIFRDAGARYVVLVTKHHDGFCLWPSDVPNPHRRDWQSPRDIVGELARAVRAVGLRFGVYYSGGIDWTFNPEPLRTLADFIGSTPGGDYPDYAEAQVRELIARYERSVLWNDISWPGRRDDLHQMIADYYDAVPDGVVNDRWQCPGRLAFLLRRPLVRRLIDHRIKRHIARHPDKVEGVIPPPVPHSDFRTPEYARFPDISAKKWEATRGMSHSFGFNRNDTEDDYTPSARLLFDFIDGVAKNGNLLLNVGPMANGAIPGPQMARLRDIGAWLRANGDAIYGTRPWARASATSAEGIDLRFTTDGARLYVMALSDGAGARITVPRAAWTPGLGVQARRVSDGAPVAIIETEDAVILSAPDAPPPGPAPAIAIDLG